jgi:predicted 3-demethylubiquinone-9 3-methyltransferase (glyoxalase superfamily)
MANVQRLTPCLWFDGQAEDAAKFYVGIFKNSRITQVARYGDAGRDVHGQAPGTVMTVAFELDGQTFTALNGGPMFKFSEAISFQVNCETQEELDDYWKKLSAGGAESQCGWLKDRYGLSWQVVPSRLPELMKNPEGANRVMAALLKMKKLDIRTLERAHAGSE